MIPATTSAGSTVPARLVDETEVHQVSSRVRAPPQAGTLCENAEDFLAAGTARAITARKITTMSNYLVANLRLCPTWP